MASNRLRSAFPMPPLWARWLLTILAFVMLSVAIVIVLHAVNNSGASQSERSAVVEANREAQIFVEEDQAPHSAPLRATAQPTTALGLAIGADMRTRVRQGQLSGPVEGVRCSSSGPARSGRAPFRCSAHAGGIAYPFVAVADRRARRLTWCKIDPPPIAGGPQEVAVSASCRA
jgi:hypothetical protein